MNINARPGSEYDEDALLAMQKEFLARGGGSGGLSTQVVRRDGPVRAASRDNVNKIIDAGRNDKSDRLEKVKEEEACHLGDETMGDEVNDDKEHDKEKNGMIMTDDAASLIDQGPAPAPSADVNPRRRRRPASPAPDDDSADVEASLDAAADRHHVTHVLTRIFERPVVDPASASTLPVGAVLFPTKKPADATGFPVAPHRSDFDVEDLGGRGGAGVSPSSGKPKSLFAKQMAAAKRKKRGTDNVDMTTATTPTLSTTTPPISRQSVVIDGSGLCLNHGDGEAPLQQQKQQRLIAAEIHRENVNKLASMDEESILAEQRKLMTSIDPSIVEFLRKKKKSTTTEREVGDGGMTSTRNAQPSMSAVITPASSLQRDVVTMEVLDDEDVRNSHFPSTPKDVTNVTNLSKTTISDDAPIIHDHLPIPPSKDLVHMDVVETEKLEWLKDVSTKPSVARAKGGSGEDHDGDDNGVDVAVEIRFDFEGRILDEKAEFPTASALYHHGDQTRAGYTLEELFSLARSQFTQQRVIALRWVIFLLFFVLLYASSSV